MEGTRIRPLGRETAMPTVHLNVLELLDAQVGFATTMVTLILLIVTAYYAFQIHNQTLIARDAVAEARRNGSDQVAAQFRPMLVPTDPPSGKSPTIPDDSETHIIIGQLVIENIGTGPALNGALQVVRNGVPGEPRPPIMMQFAQVPFGIVGVGRAIPSRTRRWLRCC